MPTVDILCLAYSIKHRGRCVAGIRLDNREWVRPVSAAEDGTLSEASCHLDVGRPPAALDIVRVPLREPRPEPHQPENWVIGDGPWTLQETLTLDQASRYIESVLEPGPMILGDQEKSIDYAWIEANGVPGSLTVIRVKPSFHVNPWRKHKAHFAFGGAFYDLTITDLSPWAREAYRQEDVTPGTDWYLTISLAEPFKLDNRCYKVVAGGLELGGQ